MGHQSIEMNDDEEMYKKKLPNASSLGQNLSSEYIVYLSAYLRYFSQCVVNLKLL